jgi:hypothetical protein
MTGGYLACEQFMHNDSAGGRLIIMLPKSYVLKYIFWHMYN